MLGSGETKKKTLKRLFNEGSSIISANRRGFLDVKRKSQFDIHGYKGDAISTYLLEVLERIIKICATDIKEILEKTHRDNKFEINYREVSLIIDDNEVTEEHQLLHIDSIKDHKFPSRRNINLLLNLDINQVISEQSSLG